MESLSADLVQRYGASRHEYHQGSLQDLGSDQLLREDSALLHDLTIQVYAHLVLGLSGLQSSAGIRLRLTVDADQS